MTTLKPFDEARCTSSMCSAFTGIARVLRPGGIVTLQVWGLPDESPYFMNAVGPFARRLSPPPPPPDAPTPLRFAPPGKLVDALAAAGFRDIREDRRSLILPWTVNVPASIVTVSACT